MQTATRHTTLAIIAPSHILYVPVSPVFTLVVFNPLPAMLVDARPPEVLPNLLLPSVLVPSVLLPSVFFFSVFVIPVAAF